MEYEYENNSKKFGTDIVISRDTIGYRWKLRWLCNCNLCWESFQNQDVAVSRKSPLCKQDMLSVLVHKMSKNHN